MQLKNRAQELTAQKRYEAILVKSQFNSSDGRVVRASASGALDSGLIRSQVKPVTLKLVFTASLLGVQYLRDSVENKPASLLVVPLGKGLSGIPPSWCVRQVAGNS